MEGVIQDVVLVHGAERPDWLTPLLFVLVLSSHVILCFCKTWSSLFPQCSCVFFF